MKNEKELMNEYQSALENGTTQATSLWSYAIEQNYWQEIHAARLTNDIITAKDENGQNLIDLAIQYNRVQIVEHFTNTLSPDNHLFIALSAAEYGHIELIDWYLARFGNAEGQAIFTAAVNSSQFGLMDYLYERHIWTTSNLSRDLTYDETIARYTWFREHGVLTEEPIRPLSDPLFRKIIEIVGLSSTSLNALLAENFNIASRVPSIIRSAIAFRTLEPLQWLKEHGFDLNYVDLTRIRIDKTMGPDFVIPVLDLLSEMGVDITFVIINAIQNANINVNTHIFKWCIEYDFNFRLAARTLLILATEAANEGDLKLLDWIYYRNLLDLSHENRKNFLIDPAFKIESMIWLIEHECHIDNTWVQTSCRKLFYKPIRHLEKDSSPDFFIGNDRVNADKYYEELFYILSRDHYPQVINFPRMINYINEKSYHNSIAAIGIIIIAKLIEYGYDISRLDQEVLSNLISNVDSFGRMSMGIDLDPLISLIRESYNSEPLENSGSNIPDYLAVSVEAQSSSSAAATTDHLEQGIDNRDSSENSGSNIPDYLASSVMESSPSAAATTDHLEKEDIELTEAIMGSTISTAALIGLIMLAESLL